VTGGSNSSIYAKEGQFQWQNQEAVASLEKARTESDRLAIAVFYKHFDFHTNQHEENEFYFKATY
jgi:hypothetical protein